MMNTPRYSHPFCFCIALAVGLLIGWIDLNVEEVQWSVLAILVIGALLGITCPHLAWLWSLVIGLCVPAMHLAARLIGYQPAYSMNNFAWTFLALIPAFIGTFGGAMARILLTSGQQ
jgi:hypothetical protein